ncbi:Toprim domain protein [Tepidimonas alkaliphilus]|uniref:Toprim domain protein n=1 Tax=Tepidimonas alkaliphilus TaxID=2588942 RepID=A0A554W4I6_9BURK|nr:toprim domain-containing protein [Tepidimonas alkaliphilus]TSE18489.1 Toprim domain protein [Tepidimonas alkaliphilus]
MLTRNARAEALLSLPLGRHRLGCPHCGSQKRRDTALSVEALPDRAVWRCHRCGWAGAIPRRSAAPPAAPPMPVRHERLSEHGRALWDACQPLRGTIGEAYLSARGCRLPPPDGHLRFHPSLPHPVTGYRGAAIVALVTDLSSGEPLTLHRTWVRADGTKASEADPPRLLLGGHAKKGGVIRLWPEPAPEALTLAEGIETALAAAWAAVPAWAAIDAGNLAALAPLPGVKRLTIAADPDGAGLQAAARCAARWRAAGVHVRVVLPSADAGDVADVARKGASHGCA